MAVIINSGDDQMLQDWIPKNRVPNNTAMKFYQSMADAEREYQKHEKIWIGVLSAYGIKAAHPDDGWVNRKENYVQLVYPQFNYHPKVGDLIALGDHEKYRFVGIKKVVDSIFAEDELKKYYFDDFDEIKITDIGRWAHAVKIKNR